MNRATASKPSQRTQSEPAVATMRDALPGTSAPQDDADGRAAARVTDACRLIEAAGGPVPLAELALRTGVSTGYLHRLFRRLTGLTPKAYGDACRARRLHAEMGSARSVTDALYAAGFGSSSRFYEADRLGMAAGNYRRGGLRTAIRFAIGQCTLGALLVAESERGICAILLGDEPEALLHDLHARFPNAVLHGNDVDFEQRVAQVAGLVEAPWLGLALPLDVRGTAFQERVWRALRDIPAGTTVSYTELARRVGAPAAVRAVAGACAANLLAVAIPCHRVVRQDGGLSGYRWGVDRKRALQLQEARRHDDVPRPVVTDSTGE
ncbi:methylated-DNA--[protein]-cysteine S-methyltransferase [Chitinasiproducens palmae]|uniref:methylated-DNA--[protein]-cysteine S-methyltransferase n=1 Tax=Chitinasiproducens palmae TaxID=1770053 RepID=A0A1H2PTW9_9BURK|nr:methylated-DNA--[protein]-cysteine S-methyltransferase [Chitinasiproducens palmae]SDV50583.1 DNA-O6-methylguanine--protein-cysteine S-methyltransferase /Transcriptional regulator Ada [Chitinasiproducens palmae]